MGKRNKNPNNNRHHRGIAVHHSHSLRRTSKPDRGIKYTAKHQQHRHKHQHDQQRRKAKVWGEFNIVDALKNALINSCHQMEHRCCNPLRAPASVSPPHSSHAGGKTVAMQTAAKTAMAKVATADVSPTSPPSSSSLEMKQKRKDKKRRKQAVTFAAAPTYAPNTYMLAELAPDHAALARRFRRDHVHGPSLTDRARDARRFNLARAKLEDCFAAIVASSAGLGGGRIRPGRNEPACFTCDDPSGHVVVAPVGALRCPLCLETLFYDDEDGDYDDDDGDH